MKKVEYEQKQVVVQKKSVKWKCEICGKEYTLQENAYTCEKIHKNKEALRKVEPKFKEGDVVAYEDKWTGRTNIAVIGRITPSKEYDRWLCLICRDNSYEGKEESALAFVCSKEEFNNITENIKSKIKEQFGVPKNRIFVDLLYDGSFNVSFNIRDKKLPVIKVKED